MLTSSVGGGGASKPPKFWFVKNPGKILENLGKISENLGKIHENLGKMAPNICTITNEDLFLEVTPKKVFMIFVGENLQAQVAEQLFGQVSGNSSKNPWHPKNLLAPTHVMLTYFYKLSPHLREDGDVSAFPVCNTRDTWDSRLKTS